MANHIIAVCEYGWILCGIESGHNADVITLDGASVVRRWTNGKGIGGLAKAENKSEYKLDPIGAVAISRNKVLFTIPCEW